jgi:fucose permease
MPPWRARRAVAALLLCQGMAVSTWVSRIPSIKAHLGLDVGELGIALLGPPVGLVVAVRTMSVLSLRRPSTTIAMWGMAAAAGTLVLPGLAWSLPTFAAALVVLGLLLGIADIATNVQAVGVERAYGRSLMSGLHAMYSVGILIGALIGSCAARVGIAPSWHLASVALVLVGVVLVATRGVEPLTDQDPDGAADLPAPAGAPRLLDHRGLLLTSLIGFCAYFAEGTVQDWSGVYLRESQGASLGTAALGAAVSGVGMVVGRAFGDRLIARLGQPAMLWRAALIATVGLGIAIGARSPAIAIAGYGVLGLGVSVIVPIAFTLAGNVPGTSSTWALGRMTMVAYSGLFAGPPIIGAVAGATSLTIALALPALLLLAIVPLAFAIARPGAIGRAPG